MPRSPYETFSAWDFNAESGAWSSRDIPGVERQLEDLSDGDLLMRGRSIRDAETGRILGNVATLRGATVLVGTMGSVLLRNHSIEPDQLNTYAHPDALLQAEVRGSIQLANEAAPREINAVTSLTSYGSALYTTGVDARGVPQFQDLRLAYDGFEQAPLNVGGLRLATPDEVMQRGLIGLFARGLSSLIDDVAVQGLVLPDGTVTTDGSEIVKGLAQLLSVTPIVTYTLKGVGARL